MNVSTKNLVRRQNVISHYNNTDIVANTNLHSNFLVGWWAFHDIMISAQKLTKIKMNFLYKIQFYHIWTVFGIVTIDQIP